MSTGGQQGTPQLNTSTMTGLKDLKHTILYGLILAALILGLKWMQWKFLIIDNAVEIYTGLVAVFFTVLGIGIATQLAQPKPRRVTAQKQPPAGRSEEPTLNETELKKLNLNSREREVLLLLAKGHSNADIAADLFLSLSTVKTHASNLYFKMDVKSRTQAIAKAKQLNIIE